MMFFPRSLHHHLLPATFLVLLTLLFPLILFSGKAPPPSLLFLSLLVLALGAYLTTRPLPVLLLDYACFRPDSDRKLSYEACEYFVRRSRRFSPSSEEFMRSIFLRSGLGNETYGPPFIFQDDYEEKYQCAIQEADEGLFSAVEALLAKTGVPVSSIDTLIAACGMFSPSPSLASRIVNRFGFPEGVRTFNLTSMGCSVGAVGCDMAARILNSRRGSSVGYVLLVVTESISLNWYAGDDKSMLVSNCIFRLGSAAVLLTNDQSRRGSAKLELTRSLITNHGADDASYGVVFQEEDEMGNVGVTLKKDLMKVAGGRLYDHVRLLAPRVLPVSQLLLHALRVIRSRLTATRRKAASRAVAPPSFTTAFEHMCVHAGGRAVIEAVQEVMGLDETVLEPARMTLHRFGNSSGPLLFYEMAYFEEKGRVREGDRVWMVSFGAGFVVCSLVWRALRDGDVDDEYNPWSDCKHIYPVKSTTIAAAAADSREKAV